MFKIHICSKDKFSVNFNKKRKKHFTVRGTELFRAVADLFFPRVCPLCGQVLLTGEEGICLSCLSDLPYVRFRDTAEGPLARVFWGRIPFRGVHAFLYYEKGNRASRLVQAIKYHGYKELGRWMGRIYGEHLRSLPPFDKVDLVVPVPLHRRKQRQRGFNQSEWIGKGIAEALQIPLESRNLYRKIYNPSQTRRGRYERWENVEGIFALRDPSLFEGKHILLVDDVITTGATLEACATAVLQAPGSSVSLAALSMARG